ncbi:NAD(P)-dependent alcohol dehydrogenase [Cucumibacter marinus]|uniref:NAD(P)-dependent alcohol dehydrogenase n=1 Tax=Cucumibacter marinus TaxID=1121252 RepID=UPI00042762AB|nr:NAD(P)-dependent alcohol dehydrogenase [Cucumibacter marinus]
MKAAIYSSYGGPDVISVSEMPRPAIKDGEVLVQVHASTVSTGDWRMLTMKTGDPVLAIIARMMFGLTKPRHPVLGSAFSGRVVAVGNGVTRFRMGDAVMGFAPHGAHAEYLAINENKAIVQKPAGVSDEDAAAMPFGALCALVFLRDFAGVKPGQKVLVTGASGGVGVFGVQIAKYLGADVTAVASSQNADLVRKLGADKVIDYKQTDFTRGSARYDLVFDTAGVTDFASVKPVLTENGQFIPLEFGIREMRQAMFSGKSGKRIKIGVNGDKREDLETLAGLMQRGALSAVIDSRYGLEDIARAYERVGTRHKRGAVIVSIASHLALPRAAA